MFKKGFVLIVSITVLIIDMSTCWGQKVIGTNLLGIIDGNYLITFELPYKQKGSLLVEGGYKNSNYGVYSYLLYPFNIKKMEDVFLRLGYCQYFSSKRSGFYSEVKIDFRHSNIQLKSAPDKDSIEAKGLVVMPMVTLGYNIKIWKLYIKPLIGVGYQVNFMNFDKIGKWPESSFWLFAETFPFQLKREDLLNYKKGFMPFMQLNVAYPF